MDIRVGNGFDIHRFSADETRPLVLGGVTVPGAAGLDGHSDADVCAHAIGDAVNIIRRGDADAMIAGGTESVVVPLAIGGFAAMRALSTRNDEPAKASRPFDVGRDGFVMGEGAGVVVLEEYDHAVARGAKIYAEVLGYGMSGDAYHITAPSEDGDGGFRSMQMALKRAGLQPADVDYINAHGTSTPAGDEIEVRAVARVLGNAASTAHLSSTKSAIGHLLGAAGSVEAIFCALAIRDGVIPPTLNLDNPSFDSPINLTPHTAVKKKVRAALSNSFGFGGTNAALVLKAPD
jgi:3-oxoacyl-[acyl-carrier-protein] synthase II